MKFEIKAIDLMDLLFYVFGFWALLGLFGFVFIASVVSMLYILLVGLPNLSYLAAPLLKAIQIKLFILLIAAFYIMIRVVIKIFKNEQQKKQIKKSSKTN